MSNPIIVCPTGCQNDVPVVSFDECNPAVDFSEVDKLYLTAINNPLADWTDAAEWATRIDNSGTDAEDIRELWVKGELPEPESAETGANSPNGTSSLITMASFNKVGQSILTGYEMPVMVLNLNSGAFIDYIRDTVF